MRTDLTRQLAAAMLSAILLTALPARADQDPNDAEAQPDIIEEVIRKVLPEGAKVERGKVTTQPAEDADDVDPNTVADLAKCRELHVKGKYNSAEKGYRKFTSDASLRLAASKGLAETLAIQGKYTDALKALQAVADDAKADADWHVAMANLLHTTGKYDDALKHSAHALDLKPAWAPAILIRGQLLETLGRKTAAVETYKSMEKVIDADDYHSDARSLVALGNILDRYGILTGRKASEQAQNILHNYLQEAYIKVDKDYWPANIAAGMLLLSKHRPQGAAQEFQLALKRNKKIPDAYVGLGAAQLSRWRFEAVLKLSEKALKINPNHPDAHLLEASCYMQWRKFDKVPPIVEKVLKVNPNHLDALSLMAAAWTRMYEQDKAEKYISQVREINPAYVGLPNTIGQWLASGRQFSEAETWYKKAISLEPKLADPWANLGLLYMQTGQEKLARGALDKAHKLDDFRSDVVNYLKILDKLDEFLVRESEHFIVKVHPRDEVLLEQVVEFMERIHGEVTADFDYEPKKKTIIEIMPTQEQFGLRISGKGWVPTVGASTGTVIVLAAPRPGTAFGTHNWATVLRHEYAHTVTLEATNNRIPHWFTEACAVWEQPDRRNYRAVKLLIGAYRANRLFDIQELDWGFIRPKRRGDRSLAYAQSEWIMEYVIEKKGYATILEMLRGYRDGMSQPEVFEKIVGLSEKEFNKKFRQWAGEQITKWGFNVDKAPDLAKTKADAQKEENAGDVGIQATYAVALYMHNQHARAMKQAEKVLKLDAENAKALAVLASCHYRKKEYDKAVEYAQRLEKAAPSSVSAAKILAQSYMAKRNWPRAITALERLQARQPLDPYSYEQLAKFYKQFGKAKEALRNLVELHRRTMKDAKYARQIAEIYRSLEEDDMALEYFEQIAHINPYEISSYQAIAEIHFWAKRYEQAITAVERMLMLQPKIPQAWTYMAKIRYYAGRKDGNREHLTAGHEAARKALELDPDTPAAKQLLDAIERELKKLDAQNTPAEAA